MTQKPEAGIIFFHFLNITGCYFEPIFCCSCARGNSRKILFRMFCHKTSCIGRTSCHLNGSLRIMLADVFLSLGNSLRMRKYLLDRLLQISHQELLLDGLYNLSHCLNICLMKEIVQRLMDTAFNGIFHRNDRVIHFPSLISLHDIGDILIGHQVLAGKGSLGYMVRKGASRT